MSGFIWWNGKFDLLITFSVNSELSRLDFKFANTFNWRNKINVSHSITKVRDFPFVLFRCTQFNEAKIDEGLEPQLASFWYDMDRNGDIIAGRPYSKRIL